MRSILRSILRSLLRSTLTKSQNWLRSGTQLPLVGQGLKTTKYTVIYTLFDLSATLHAHGPKPVSTARCGTVGYYPDCNMEVETANADWSNLTLIIENCRETSHRGTVNQSSRHGKPVIGVHGLT